MQTSVSKLVFIRFISGLVIKTQQKLFHQEKLK